jgi:hypothetical protein
MSASPSLALSEPILAFDPALAAIMLADAGARGYGIHILSDLSKGS